MDGDVARGGDVAQPSLHASGCQPFWAREGSFSSWMAGTSPGPAL